MCVYIAAWRHIYNLRINSHPPTLTLSLTHTHTHIQKTQELAHALGGGHTHPHTHITICLKAREDIIADKGKWVVVTEEGAKRRSGGLGDILAGTMGVLLHWSRLMNEENRHAQTQIGGEGGGEGVCKKKEEGKMKIEERDSVLYAAAGASIIARKASREAFVEKKRSMTAPDAIGMYVCWMYFVGVCVCVYVCGILILSTYLHIHSYSFSSCIYTHTQPHSTFRSGHRVHQPDGGVVIVCVCLYVSVCVNVNSYQCR
jgi:hypothetical protein